LDTPRCKRDSEMVRDISCHTGLKRVLYDL
jgi:hypothetical protein